jgi:hypothetical protein
MPGLRRIILIAVFCAAAAFTACSRTDDRIQPTAAEQELLDKIVADPFVEIVQLERRDTGELQVLTRQGSTRVRYLLAPSPSDRTVLAIHLVDDAVSLRISDDATIGTGPEQRGLNRR